MIEHVVLSGAGPNGLVQVGFIAELMRAGHLKNIKSVYGTSSGAFVNTILAFNLSMDEYGEYMVGRPWNKWIDLNLNLSEINSHCGIFKWEIMHDFIRPFLFAHGIPDSITLKEAYDQTKVDMHIFATELESFCLVDLNHKTFPNLQLLKAISMSAALFPLFRPVAHEGKNYADGGLRNHFPIDELFAANPGKDTILGLNMVGVAPTFCSTMTSFETFFYVLYRTSVEIAMSDKTHELAKQCKYYMGHCNSASVMESKLWESFFTTPECRQNKRAEGTRLGLDFIQTKF